MQDLSGTRRRAGITRNSIEIDILLFCCDALLCHNLQSGRTLPMLQLKIPTRIGVRDFWLLPRAGREVIDRIYVYVAYLNNPLLIEPC